MNRKRIFRYVAVAAVLTCAIGLYVALAPDRNTGPLPTPAPARPVGAAYDNGSVRGVFLSGDADDWEPSLALGPTGVIHVSATRRTDDPQTSRMLLRTVVWTSRDGGESFKAPVIPSPEVESQGDARIKTDRKGTVYATWIAHDRDLEGETIEKNSGLALAVSQDGAKSFTTRIVADAKSGVADKPEVAVSPDGQQLYVAVEGVGGPLLLASTDAGQSWSQRRIVATQTQHYWPTAFDLTAEGKLWLSVPSFPHWALRLRRSVIEGTLHVMSSGDQGITWNDHIVARVPRGRRGCIHDPGCLKVPAVKLAVAGTDRIYVVHTDGVVKHPYRLLFTKSLDGGRTWSKSVVLSNALRPLSADRADHDHPEIVASESGLVYVVWIDNRAGPYNLFARRSTDGGDTWSAEVSLSPPGREGIAGFYGDYGGVAIDAAGSLHLAWSEGVGSVGRPGSKGGTWYVRWTL